jgi:hypothetical protein
MKNRSYPTPKSRRASERPAIPWEGPAHPAAYDDPAIDAFAKGDTSAWAEDPHPGPYNQPLPPAIPTEDGGHPASRKAYVRLVEKKAALSTRIATALLTRGGTRVASNRAIEARAMELMEYSIPRLNSMWARIAAEEADEEVDEVEVEEEETDKEARRILARRRLAALKARLAADEDEDEDDADDVEEDEDSEEEDVEIGRAHV